MRAKQGENLLSKAANAPSQPDKVASYCLKFAFFIMFLSVFFLILGQNQAQASDTQRSIRLSAFSNNAPAHDTSAPTHQGASFQARTTAVPLFGTNERISHNIEPFEKWTGMLNRYDRQMRTAQAAPFKAWFARLEHLREADFMQKVRQVNNIVNLNRYVPDIHNYGVSDHWSTPVEFFARQAGDCEDFAIAKMMTLKKLGVPESQMRIAVVQDTIKNIPHAVLIVYHNNQAYVLDNQIKNVVTTNQVPHYMPFYSITRSAWWRHEPADNRMAAIMSNALSSASR